jgi:hypothetical protein
LVFGLPRVSDRPTSVSPSDLGDARDNLDDRVPDEMIYCKLDPG